MDWLVVSASHEVLGALYASIVHQEIQVFLHSFRLLVVDPVDHVRRFSVLDQWNPRGYAYRIFVYRQFAPEYIRNQGLDLGRYATKEI